MNYAAGMPMWTDLMTPVTGTARAFYTALFGWTFQDSGPEYGGYTMAYQGGKTAAGIGSTPEGSGMPSVWTVYFASDDLAADASRVRALGGQVMVEPMKVGDQGHMGIFTDPTGAAFGLWQPERHTGAQSRDEEGSVIWVEINTRDSASALAFYTALLGARSEAIPGMDYHQLFMGEQAHAGISGMGENWEAVMPAHWVTYFYTADVDAAATTAEANGGGVLVAPFDMPYGRMAVLADPGGAAFSVMTPAPRTE